MKYIEETYIKREYKDGKIYIWRSLYIVDYIYKKWYIHIYNRDIYEKNINREDIYQINIYIENEIYGEILWWGKD